MIKNRKQITDFICTAINEIIPDNFNAKRTRRQLDSMSDAEFEQYLKDIANQKKYLSIIEPNGADVRLDLERNFAVGKKYNIKFFKRIWLDTPDGKGRYLSKYNAMVIRLPCRRQSQLLIKKQSIPDNNRSIDALTGQPAGKSTKSAQISFPELQMLVSLGLNKTAIELMKFRGGDTKAFNAMNRSIANTGSASQEALKPYTGKVKSTDTLSRYLTAMMLINNL